MKCVTSHWEGQSLEELRRRWVRPHVHLYGLVDSTNNRAKELAQSGAPSGTVVVADGQSAGRGNAQRRWHSPAGSGVYVSIILRPASVPNPLLVPLLAGLGAARAVERSAVGIRVGLKWPNDLIAGDRKLGGVLAEGVWVGKTPTWVVIGVGINVRIEPADFPEALQPIATSLDVEAGRRVSRLALAGSVIEAIESSCAELPERLDADLLAQLRRRDWLRDRLCVVEDAGGGRLCGVGVGIAADGTLMLRPVGGEPVAISTGRVRADGLSTPEF